MDKLTFSLAVALLCGTVTIEVSAQQGQGQGVGLTSNTRGNLGVNSRSTLAHGQGALRSIGRSATAGGTSVGAQLSASGALNGTGSVNGAGSVNGSASVNGTGSIHAGRKGDTQTSGKHRGLSLRARARSEMHARIGGRKGQNTNPGTSPNPSPEPESTPTPEPGTTPPSNGSGQTPWERAGCSRADWHLAQRLAVIDRQRDIAVQNGNEVLLEKADKLEAQVRLQYEQRTGVFADKPGSGGTNPPPAGEPSTPPSEPPPPASETPPPSETTPPPETTPPESETPSSPDESTPPTN